MKDFGSDFDELRVTTSGVRLFCCEPVKYRVLAVVMACVVDLEESVVPAEVKGLDFVQFRLDYLVGDVRNELIMQSRLVHTESIH